MKIGFIFRTDAPKEEGDNLTIIEGLMRGLNLLDHKAVASTSPFSIPDADFFLFSNSTLEQKQLLEEVSLLNRPFGLLGFQEDLLRYYIPASGFCKFVLHCLGYGLPTDNGLHCHLDLLIERPDVAYYYGEPPKRVIPYNHPLIRKASFWIANSPTEAKTLQRDFPGCKTAVIPVPPSIATEYQGTPDDSFLQYSGLGSKNYLLQVGMLEPCKNQLGTILATRHLDIPLVFIATTPSDYGNICFEAAVKWRKAPTIFISESIEARKEGSVRMIPISQGKKIPSSILLSAYHHAGLYIHPAFQDLPGTTYLAAARLGVPTIASSWSPITDYLFDPEQGHSRLDGRILYYEPYRLNEIEQGVIQHFGKEFPPLLNHITILRTEKQSAQDLITAIE
ncbi:MAG: hypothetical protein KGZ39_00630 [Simkania sp.]|nr:hypothetical protein [Simkania sp.]